MTYFIADTHFGHCNIIEMCRRPFGDIQEMNEALINNWNRKVRGNDTVYVLGDMFYRCEASSVESILSRLKGKKYLIRGNHDKSWLDNCHDAKYRFNGIETLLETSISGHGMTLCHYPLVTYKHKATHYHIHGHIHNDTTADYWPLLKIRPLVLNAGVDINHFEPVTLEELIENNRVWKETH